MNRKMFAVCAVAMVALVLPASMSRANSIDTLQGWDGGSGIDGVGETWGYSLWVARSLGQTFKVNSEARLNSMTFAVNDVESQKTKVDVVVMEWGGSAPTGSVLYRTGPVTSSQSSVYNTLTVSLGNTLVQPDKEYIAILTTSPYMDGIQNRAMVSFAWNNYADGSFFFHDGFAPNDELTGGWTNADVIDLGVRIDYTPVPEPTTMAMLAIGAVGIVRRRR
jgi:hypothetical protein